MATSHASRMTGASLLSAIFNPMSKYQNWREDDVQKVALLETYADMKDVALIALKALPQPVVQVCGPLTTGGRGSFEKNLEMFHEGIQFLAEQGKTVFDQRPFEIPMQKLKATRKGPGYAYELLYEFYLPVFQSGHVKELHFLPGWESSIGARWEHDQAQQLGITIFYLPKSLLNPK